MQNHVSSSSSLTRLAVILFISLSGVAHIANAADRSFMWIVGDPHLFSVKKGYEVCNIQAESKCFSITNKVTILCTGTPADSANANSSLAKLTVLSNLKISFTNGANTQFYNVTDPTLTLAPTFSSGVASVLTAAKTPWLELNYINYLSTASLVQSSIIIYDFTSSTSISIIQYFKGAAKLYMLTVGTITSQLDTTSGILYNGCDSALTSPVFQGTVTGCDAVTSSDTILTTGLAKQICNLDGLINADFVGATTIAAAGVAATRLLDTVEFSAASTHYVGFYSLFISLFTSIICLS